MADRRTPEALSAGRVGRPHGLDGGFYVTRPRPRLLEPGMRVTIGADAHEIAQRSGVEQRPIVNLRGVHDRSAAEALRGLELCVPLADAPALQAGEWWAHELQGCEVHSTGNQLVGTVAALLELPSCEVLQVTLSGGGELLVPMVKDAVRHVDVATRHIEIDLEFLGETEAGTTGDKPRVGDSGDRPEGEAGNKPGEPGGSLEAESGSSPEAGS